MVCIHPHQPRLNPRRNPVRLRQILRPDSRPQPILALIRELDAITFARERLHHHDGPENLLLPQFVLDIDVCEDRGGEEAALHEVESVERRGAGHALPADEDLP